MRAYESRLRTLESKVKPDTVDTLLIVGISPSGVDAPLVRIDADSQRWHVRAGESEDEFVERARREVNRRPGQIVALYGHRLER